MTQNAAHSPAECFHRNTTIHMQNTTALTSLLFFSTLFKKVCCRTSATVGRFSKSLTRQLLNMTQKKCQPILRPPLPLSWLYISLLSHHYHCHASLAHSYTLHFILLFSCVFCVFSVFNVYFPLFGLLGASHTSTSFLYEGK